MGVLWHFATRIAAARTVPRPAASEVRSGAAFDRHRWPGRLPGGSTSNASPNIGGVRRRARTRNWMKRWAEVCRPS